MPEKALPRSARTEEEAGPTLGVDDARALILSAFRPLAAVDLPINVALGLVTSEDVIADVEVPPFTNSAMDGYAVLARDTREATSDRPVYLKLIGELPAG